MLNQTRLSIKSFILFAAFSLVTVTLQAQTFNIVKEINSNATVGSISNTGMATVGDKVLFFSDDGINGQELWRTDGTTAGTQRLTDILPGAFPGIGASPQSTVGNGVFYFAASDASELWRSDGTEAGTYLLKFFGGTNRVSQMFFHNGILYLVANDGINGFEPWISDGTPGGTVLLKDIFPGANASLSANASPYYFVAMGPNVYFPATNGTNGRELWKTDGTTAGTVMVKDVNPGSLGGINQIKAAAHDGKIYFAANNNTLGIELWATDGTDAGTYLVRDISPGSGNASPNNLISFNGSLFFSASNNNNNTPGLWKTDGTAAGTVLVRDLAADGIFLTVGFNFTNNFFTVNGNTLYFRGGLATGTGLFASDGTTAGTALVKAVGGTGGFFSFNGLLYFQGSGPESSNFPVLYKSDGTAGGTVPVFEGALLSGLSVVAPQNLPILNNKLFFVGDSQANGPELWSTDGTSAGTNLIKDINLVKSGSPTNSQTIAGSAFLNGNFYFTAGDEDHGVELWKTDGTSDGTMMVKDIFPGARNSGIFNFCVVGNQVFFIADDGVNGRELWRSDGTETGTQMVKDINPGFANGAVGRFTPSGSYVYFLATHPETGTEMWRSDGTEAGTTLVADLTPGTGSGFSNANTHFTYQNKAFIINSLGNKLYVADGIANTFTEFSTEIIAAYDMATIGNTLYVGGRNASGQNVLWRSDNGAAPVQFKVVRSTDGGTNAMYQFANCNGKLYFNANDGTTGNEPWVSDGTEAGTFRLKDIQAGAGSSQPFSFTASGDKVFFQARSTGADAELWATDGTEAGTYLVKDINPGVTGSNPNAFLAIPGGKVLFTANNGVNGVELWQSNGTDAGTTLLRDFNATGNGFGVAALFLNFKENYYLWPFNNGVLFFARSADRGNQLYFGSLAPQNLYVNDNSNVDDTFTSATGNDNNPGTAEAPLATIQKAVQLATEGSTIYVDAGSYVEQVTITKGITITGAGRSKTLVTLPETTAPAPGSFPERGTFQTTAGITDVHISELSATGRLAVGFETITPVIIQGGGSVRNCNLQGGNQGIFFRVPSGIKTALAENNIIEAEYIGINFEGSGITGSMLNNDIVVNNSGFSAGVFANGPLVQFTATGNTIRNYVTYGFSANSNNAVISQNSIIGRAGLAIQSGTAVSATCNWFGTADAAGVAAAISGNVNYTPWLLDGTDVEPESIGFQPMVDVCNGMQTEFYVNDNSTTGDTFTTAIGNNANPGMPSSPFATIQHAVNVAPAGSTIYVDAGSYVEQVTIAKGLTVKGAGKGITIVNGPAGELIRLPDFPDEPAIIQSTQNIGEVKIEDITIDGSLSTEQHSILIQGSGRVVNCEMRNANNGIFFREVTGGACIAEAIGNHIHNISYVGILFAGTGMDARAFSNTIDLNGAVFGMGFLAGYGGNGSIDNLTAENNFIIDHNGFGFSVNAAMASITNNSITAISGGSILNGTGVPITATCNWFGDTDAATIATKVSAGVNYTPWLTNGTDADPATIGFQPLPDVCNGTPVVATLMSQTNISCFGGNNGSADVTISGGVLPYTTTWSREGDIGFSQNGEDLLNAPAGNYTLVVTDAAGSTNSVQISLTEPVQLLVSATGTNVSCFSGNNGSATATDATGGASGYSYLWSNGGSAQTISGLTAGTYTVTVTDANGCTTTASYEVTQPELLVATASGTNVTCFGGSNGTATVSVSGGTTEYTYLWSNGATSQSINGLSAGTYSVTVTDANGCTSAGSYTVTQPSAVNPAVRVTGITCNGAGNGIIEVTGRGGTAPYTFSLDGLTYATGNIFNGLPAGSYTIYVRDANACVGTISATIGEPALLTVELTNVSNTCAGINGGAINVTVSGGTGRYSFAWRGLGGFSANREDISGLSAGLYNLTVTDANGCIASLDVLVEATPALVITGNITPVSCFGTLTGAVDVSVNGGSGSGYTFVWSGPNGFKGTTEDVNGLRAGSYTLTVTDAGGCSGSQTFTVTQPAVALSVTATKVDITACDALGSITVTAAGGTAPYQYSLNGGTLQSSNVFAFLAAGNYTIQATDANGCTTAPISVSIEDNGADAFEANNTVGAAFNINVGSNIRARLAASKGTDVDWYSFTTTATGSYSISWSHPSVPQTFDLYLLNRNKAVLINPTTVVGNTKNYANLAANTYFVQVSGTQSFVCYDLVVGSLTEAPLITSATIVGNQAKTIITDDQPLTATVFPNPHRGIFTLRIESPVNGEGHVTLYDLTGRALTEQKVMLQKGSNAVRFERQLPVSMVYRVLVDGKVVTGKVIGIRF